MSAKSRIAVITGEDDYLVERAAKNAIAGMLPQGADPRQCVEIVDGAAGKAETQLRSIALARASLATPPFLEPAKATWWKNVTFLPGGAEKRKLAEDVKKALEDFAATAANADIPQNQCLAITAPSVLGTSVFMKRLAAKAEVIHAGGGGKASARRDGAISFLMDEAAALGLELQSGIAAAIVAKRGVDSRALESELAKIRDWMEPGRKDVPREAVDEVVSPGAEPELWDLTDAVSARDAAKISRVLASFDGTDQSACIPLVHAVEKLFRDLAVLRDMLDRGIVSPHGSWTARAAGADLENLGLLGYNPSAPLNFIQKRKLEAASRFSGRVLRRAHMLATELRERMVSSSGGADAIDLLNNLLLRVIS